jgi:hypothetical protein
VLSWDAGGESGDPGGEWIEGGLTMPEIRLIFLPWFFFPGVFRKDRSLILTSEGWSESPWPSFDPRLRPPYPRMVRETRVFVCVLPMFPVLLSWVWEVPIIDREDCPCH